MKEKYSVLNFYRRSLLVSIEGFRIERLVQKAFERGIAIRSLRIVSETRAEGWIAGADLKELRRLAKSLYHIKVIDGRGPEQKIRQAAARPTAVIGTILATAIVIVQSLFISEIRIDGYRAIPETELRKCLAGAGVSPGVFRPAVDWQKAETALDETFPQLSWIQLVYDGRVVYLNVSESTGKILSGSEEDAERNPDIFTPAHKEEDGCISIYADCSGYIESMSTLWGMALAEPGDYVEKGQELISGVVPMEATTFEEGWPTEYYVRARGQIIARVPYHEVFSQERYIRGEDVLAGEDGENDGTVIVNRVEKTREQAEAVVNQQIRLWAKENLPEKAEIINKSLNFCYKKNIIDVGVTLEVRREIGIEKEIPVGQENSDN